MQGIRRVSEGVADDHPLVATGGASAYLHTRQAICTPRGSLNPCILLHFCTRAVPPTQGYRP
jgi:hypothetical protein